MPQTCETPPGEAGLAKSSLRGSFDDREITPFQAATQAKIDLLVDDLGCNVSAMMAQLDVVLAMRAANDMTGLLYGLRRARAYWSAIAASARELASSRTEASQ
jgi:hypothetical protein